MKAEIEINGRRGSIRLDGQEVSRGTRGFILSAGVDELPRLELDLQIFEYSRVTGEVEVTIPEATVEALKTLGWTSPEVNRDTT